jgi:hypothetical protein
MWSSIFSAKSITTETLGLVETKNTRSGTETAGATKLAAGARLTAVGASVAAARVRSNRVTPGRGAAVAVERAARGESPCFHGGHRGPGPLS